MEIRRTANAGVLLRIDGKAILLDGVCGEVAPYLKTPDQLYQQLLAEHIDAVAFTHTHPDHYDGLFVSDYLQKSAGPVMGPAEISVGVQGMLRLDGVQITPVESRHIGKTDCTQHRSYIITGSRCVWFMGDASPLHWQSYENLPHPDVLIAPYGFLIGRGWDYCKKINPGIIILLHLPERENDPYGLWEAVKQIPCTENDPKILIPDMGQSLNV